MRLGVNIDHVATIRNARGGAHPDPIRAAHFAETAGADGITAHLREDRRHMNDVDIRRLSEDINLPLNLEMAPTEEMLKIALRHKPHAVCIVPEKREERTTEGGLDVSTNKDILFPFVCQLKEAGIRVSLFVEPNIFQIEAAKALNVNVVELHTGSYCEAPSHGREVFFKLIEDAAIYAESLDLECHAGHGLSFETVKPIAAIPLISELNIGHFLVGEAIFIGLENAIKQMKNIMNEARFGNLCKSEL